MTKIPRSREDEIPGKETLKSKPPYIITQPTVYHTLTYTYTQSTYYHKQSRLHITTIRFKLCQNNAKHSLHNRQERGQIPSSCRSRSLRNSSKITGGESKSLMKSGMQTKLSFDKDEKALLKSLEDNLHRNIQEFPIKTCHI